MERIVEIRELVLLKLGDFTLTLGQILILGLGLVLIFIVNQLGKRIIRRSKRLSTIGDRLKALVIRGYSYFIWIVGIVLLLRLEHVNTQSFFNFELFVGDKVTITVQKVFVFIVIIFIVRIVVLFADYLMNRKIEKDHLDYGKGNSILQILKYFIWIVGVIIGIGVVGLKLTFIIASVSALLVGVGFGLQHIFNDLFSGIIILFDGSIKVNDIVQVSDIIGRVKDIGIRTTKIVNRDNIVLIVPNSKFTSDSVINWSHMDQKSRFSISVGVAYGSDVRLVEKILLECANENNEVDTNPAPFVRFEDFGESSLDFCLYIWTDQSFFVENIKSQLRFSIDEKFKLNKITIPFPQRDLHIIDPRKNE
jgi:small-conductance mechanosensitive channel